MNPPNRFETDSTPPFRPPGRFDPKTAQSHFLPLALLFTLSVTLATQLSLQRELSPSSSRPAAGNLIEMIMGDSRRLFASHFFVKADVYLHSGFYPSIFDQGPRPSGPTHLAGASADPGTGQNGRTAQDRDHAQEHEQAHAHDHDHDHDQGKGKAEHQHEDLDDDDDSAPLPPPRDWIEAFGRQFVPNRHTHLSKLDQREVLPWLRFAADLNPNQVESYTVAAYWLRGRMGRIDDAEAFLREGARHNPDSYEIQFELGRLYDENRRDPARARNLFELALAKWQRLELSKPHPDRIAFMQIIGHLARLEKNAGRLDHALHYLTLLHKVSPHPDLIQQQIDALRAELARSHG